MLSAIVKVEFPLLSFELPLLGVAVGLDIVAVWVGEERSELKGIVVVPDSALRVEVTAPDAIFDVKRVVDGDPSTKREFVVMIVVSSANEVSVEAAVVDKEEKASVDGVLVLVSASVDVGVAAGIAEVSSGGSFAGVTIPRGSSGNGPGGLPLSPPCGPRSCFGMLGGLVTGEDMATSEGAAGSVYAS